MRIHTDTIDWTDVSRAVTIIPNAYAEVTSHGSRKRHHALEVKLTATDRGEGRRAGNTGQYGARDLEDGYALMWDEWGDVIARLYEKDPTALIGPYESAEHFHWTTGGRFDRHNTNGNRTTPHVHRWTYAGVSVTGSYHVSECKGTPSRGIKCDAITRRPAAGLTWDEVA